jgi:peptide/nickel transport system permease protein
MNDILSANWPLFAAAIFSFLIFCMLCCGPRARLPLIVVVAILAIALFLLAGEIGLQALSVLAAAWSIVAVVCLGLRLLLSRLAPASSAATWRRAPLTAIFGLLVIAVYVLVVAFAPQIAPFSQSDVVSAAYSPPDDVYWLGTDQLGRDMFSRIVYGGRNSVLLAFTATMIAFAVGGLAGLYAAIRGGLVDQVFGRVADILMSVPALILALLLLSILGTNLTVLVGVVAVIYVPRIFRLTRAVSTGVSVTEFVEASRARGEGDWYLIRREILPNVTAPLIAEFGLEFCYVFLLIAGLSFLGLGIQPPLADWGSMVRENAALISFGDATPLIPASALALLTVGVNFVVDWMLKISSGLKEAV